MGTCSDIIDNPLINSIRAYTNGITEQTEEYKKGKILKVVLSLCRFVFFHWKTKMINVYNLM